MIGPVLIALGALGQGPAADPPRGGLETIAPAEGEGHAEIDPDCGGAEDFGGTRVERGGFCLLMISKYVGARALADRALREDPSSYRAHYLMGTAQHLGEGNLPKALFHLKRAEELFEERHGDPRGLDETNTSAYRRTLLELAYVHGEMDHHEEKIRYVDALSERLGLDYGPLKAWPLLKLKRFEEARAIAKIAVEVNEGASYWRAIGLTALCAVESELRNREAAYEACRAAAAPVLNDPHDGGVAMSNAAAAALEMFKFDEAERFYIESTKRDVEGTINPWGRLTHLYLRQGRFAEALSALRQMHQYRLRRPAYFDQQDQADAELTGAAVLLIAGRAQDALRITTRVVGRPDRQGTSSAASDQNEGGNLLVDRVARLEVARRLEEQASWSPFLEAMKLRGRALVLRTEAWLSGRKVARILANEERLLTTLRPECPGSLEAPSWLDAEIVEIVGPGVALAGLRKARAEETLEPAFSGPVFDGLEAEAALLDGRHEAALRAAVRAVEGLPAVESLSRARARGVAVRAAMALGDRPQALAQLEQIMLSDPGLVRRVGLRLPVRVSALEDHPAVRRAIAHVEGSPRFEVAPWGFSLEIGAGEILLALPDGSRVSSVRVQSGPTDDVEVFARRIARSVHEELFVPNVDVTQGDVRSLDGGLTGGGRASERVKSVMDEVIGE